MKNSRGRINTILGAPASINDRNGVVCTFAPATFATPATFASTTTSSMTTAAATSLAKDESSEREQIKQYRDHKVQHGPRRNKWKGRRIVQR